MVALGILAVSGLIHMRTLLMTSGLLPFLALGAFLSRYVHHRLDGPLLRWIALGGIGCGRGRGAGDGLRSVSYWMGTWSWWRVGRASWS